MTTAKYFVVFWIGCCLGGLAVALYQDSRHESIEALWRTRPRGIPCEYPSREALYAHSLEQAVERLAVFDGPDYHPPEWWALRFLERTINDSEQRCQGK